MSDIPSDSDISSAGAFMARFAIKDFVRSAKPFFIHAFYEWCLAHGYVPLLHVNVDQYTRVPLPYIHDGHIVLNIEPDAVSGLVLGDEWIEFSARFNGVAQNIQIPIGRVEMMTIESSDVAEGVGFSPQMFFHVFDREVQMIYGTSSGESNTDSASLEVEASTLPKKTSKRKNSFNPLSIVSGESHQNAGTKNQNTADSGDKPSGPGSSPRRPPKISIVR